MVTIDLKLSGVEMVAVLVGDGGGEKLECAVVKNVCVKTKSTAPAPFIKISGSKPTNTYKRNCTQKKFL